MKYGMKYSTIKYWVNQGYWLRNTRGYVPCFPINMERTSREIGHDAIVYAQLLSAEQFRILHSINGNMVGKW